MKNLSTWACAFALLCACGNSHTPAGDAGPPTGDAGPRADAGTRPDAAPRPDAGPPDCVLSEPAAHRAAAATCDDVRAPQAPPDFGEWECSRDEDCADGRNGRCTGNGHDGWRCSYDLCFEDGDCESGGVCHCGGGWRTDANVCKPGNCRTDGDCGPGGFCSPTFGDCGDYGGVVGFYCHTCDDECVDDADCVDGSFGPGYCAYQTLLGRWVCQDSHCAG